MKQVDYTTQKAKAIKADLKKSFPKCKFSVTKKSGAYSMKVTLVSGDIMPVILDHDCVMDGYAQINHFYPENDDKLTTEGRELMIEVMGIVKKNWSLDDYLSLEIGKWDHGYVHVG
jgi:hypothetical protein